MELKGNQPLLALLRASQAGEIALFAVFFGEEEADIESLNSDPATDDARGRKIYDVFRRLNPPGDDDLELCTDLHFNADEADLELAPGTIIDREVNHAVFGRTVTRLVKLTSEDADFLIGVLPDELLDQIAVYDDVNF